MLGLKSLVRSSILVCVLPFWATCSLLQTSPPVPPPFPPQYSSGPVTEYDRAQPNIGDVLRFRRGERYNSPNSTLPPLGEDSDSVLIVEDMGDYYREGEVQEVLKTPQGHDIKPTDSIDVERQGGAIRLPSGKLLIRGSRDFSMPLVGKRYLFFLRFNRNTEDSHIVTGYQLEGQHIYRLDELDYAHSDRHHDNLIHTLRQETGNEDQFLGRVRAKRPPLEGE